MGIEKDPLIFSNKRRVQRKLPLWRKLSYAVGSLAYSMCGTVLGFYLIVFLLEVALLQTEYVLLIVFLGRLWDGITDPMVGYLCGRTKTKLGQFRPWLIISAVPLGIAYILLWFVPGINNQPLSFLYYITMYFAVQAFLTCVHVPFTALNVHLSYDQKETDSVTMYRLIFELVGTVIGVMIYTVMYAGFVRQEDVCAEGARESSTEKQRAYRYQAVVLSIVSVVSVLITFFAVREQKDIVVQKSKQSFIGGIKETFGFKPYRELILMTLFSWLALAFSQGNYVLYVKYGLGLESQYPYVIGVLLLMTILWIPFWQLMMAKFEKKDIFRVNMLILLPAIIVLLFLDYYPYLIYPLAIAAGAGISGIYLIPWSMLPDVIDASYLERGERREELFYAFFVFGIKCASGLSLAISTGIYKIGGYDELSCDQPWSVPLMFKILVSGPPVICIIISLLFLHRYPITDAMRKETARKLKERRENEQDVKRNEQTAVITVYNQADNSPEGRVTIF